MTYLQFGHISAFTLKTSPNSQDFNCHHLRHCSKHSFQFAWFTLSTLK